MKTTAEIERVALDDPRLLFLIRSLDKELVERDGEDHSIYAKFNILREGSCAVIAIVDGDAVGCGAFRGLENGNAEIKRMFVDRLVRGKRVGAKILEALESWAVEDGFESCVLETGHKQPEAIRLYERQGYKRIANYGQYAEIENSLCMKKRIVT